MMKKKNYNIWPYLAVMACRGQALYLCKYVFQLYLIKNHKFANNSATAKAREKISKYLESLEFQKIAVECLIHLKTINKSSPRYLVATKL